MKSKRTILTFSYVMDTYLLNFCITLVEKIEKNMAKPEFEPGSVGQQLTMLTNTLWLLCKD